VFEQMKFQKLTQTKFKGKSSIIAEQILQMIKTGSYKTGDKLLPERIIAEQMGVSRPSVREAISALQISGILETRPGDGTYIYRSPATDDFKNHALSILEESESPYEILQARRAMEIGVVRLAIEIAPDEDLLGIKQAWDEKYEMGRKGHYEAYTKYGKDFHLSIAKATNNNVIITIMDSLLDITHQPLWVNMRKAYYEANPYRIEQMLEVHNDIVQAILERDTEKAIQALEADFDNVLKQLYHQHD
jgi:GntR family transcriptional repressor for pyruvate dehydrogenase complex